jgi:hypothetical protein
LVTVAAVADSELSVAVPDTLRVPKAAPLFVRGATDDRDAHVIEPDTLTGYAERSGPLEKVKAAPLEVGNPRPVTVVLAAESEASVEDPLTVNVPKTAPDELRGVEASRAVQEMEPLTDNGYADRITPEEKLRTVPEEVGNASEVRVAAPAESVPPTTALPTVDNAPLLARLAATNDPFTSAPEPVMANCGELPTVNT